MYRLHNTITLNDNRLLYYSPQVVTTLEPDNEIYNQGIVDVSHKYPKMFIIRPQFFQSFLLLLRSLSMDKTDLRKTIADLKAKNIDATNLENDLSTFRDAILKCHASASNCKDKAIEKIDKIIQILQDIKDDLSKMDNHTASAERKAEKLTINKLEKKYPAILPAETVSSSEPIVSEERMAV